MFRRRRQVAAAVSGGATGGHKSSPPTALKGRGDPHTDDTFTRGIVPALGAGCDCARLRTADNCQKLARNDLVLGC
ncbi:hypothetical protein EVAR_3958_1 [Eumeta japonica]|uniref:Uncharacterized protein n=1 Tax=Eumeta variegata TaxID=151549 RepID=A0A4C1STP5_EUMVA|nr:hypothetical protein EVAR_3958_1 [Eumeta japonica]